MTEDRSHSKENRLVIGKITGVYGVKGWIKVFSYTEPREGILDYNPWYLGRPKAAKDMSTNWVSVKLVQGRKQGKGIIARLEACDDRDQAMLLMGNEIAIDESQLARLDNDDFYWRDLIGMSVVNLQGDMLGEVSSLMETGANDVLVVKGKAKKDLLIPWTPGHSIINVDREAGSITADWLLEWSDIPEQDKK